MVRGVLILLFVSCFALGSTRIPISPLGCGTHLAYGAWRADNVHFFSNVTTGGLEALIRSRGLIASPDLNVPVVRKILGLDGGTVPRAAGELGAGSGRVVDFLVHKTKIPQIWAVEVVPDFARALTDRFYTSHALATEPQLPASGDEAKDELLRRRRKRRCPQGPRVVVYEDNIMDFDPGAINPDEPPPPEGKRRGAKRILPPTDVIFLLFGTALELDRDEWDVLIPRLLNYMSLETHLVVDFPVGPPKSPFKLHVQELPPGQGWGAELGRLDVSMGSASDAPVGHFHPVNLRTLEFDSQAFIDFMISRGFTLNESPTYFATPEIGPDGNPIQRPRKLFIFKKKHGLGLLPHGGVLLPTQP